MSDVPMRVVRSTHIQNLTHVVRFKNRMCHIHV